MTDSHPAAQDRTFDVIVVGSGIAGLTAALTSARLGLRVCVLEKDMVIGGTSAYSEAMAWIPCSRQARTAGLADSPDAAFGYIAAAGEGKLASACARRYVDTAAKAMAFLEDNSPVRYELTLTSSDYHPHLPHSTKGRRSLSPVGFDGRALGSRFSQIRWPLRSLLLFGGMTVAGPHLTHFYKVGRSPQSTWIAGKLFLRFIVDRLSGYPRGAAITGGNAVVAALVSALDSMNVPIVVGQRVSELIREGGRVVGVRTDRGTLREPGDSGPRWSATKGVVLASGGFSHDTRRRSLLYPHMAQGKNHHTLAPASVQGDGANLAEATGGAIEVDLLQPAAWAPVSMLPIGAESVPVPHFSDRAKPGVIAVTRHGKRFVNEACSYHQFVPAMITACADDPVVEAFLICDHRAIRKYGLGRVPPFPGRIGPFVKSEYLRQGRDIESLARALGVDTTALSGTVERYNRSASQGLDPDFGKGSDDYQRSNGDPDVAPNPCLAPIQEPPYFGLRIMPGDLGTFAGIKTNEEAQVLDREGKPIAGLYACGSDMVSAMGGAYPAAGIGVGAGITFAYIAACHLANRPC